MANGGDLIHPRADDEAQIDVQSDAEIERWAKKLGVPKEEFRRAADQAGPRIGDIREHLVGGFTGAGPTS